MSHSSTDAYAQHLAGADRGALIILNRDLFVGVRIGNTLRGLGYEVIFTQDAVAFADHLRTADAPPALGVIDLSAGVNWSVIQDLTGDDTVSTPILVFGPHKDVDGMRAARSAGVTRVVSNGDFHRDMVGLIQRYATG